MIKKRLRRRLRLRRGPINYYIWYGKFEISVFRDNQ